MAYRFPTLLGICAIAALVFTLPAQAQERNGPVVALKVGTAGLGAEVTYGLSHIVRVRAGAYGFKAGFDVTDDDIEYDMDLRLLSGGGYVDLHPFKNRFRLSAGIIYNGNRMDATGQTAGDFIIGNESYTPDEIGTLVGDVDFRTFSPYVGIGFGAPLSNESNWHFEADLGVIFQAEPDVTLDAVGGVLEGNAELRADLLREAEDLTDEIRKFRFYPILSVGVGYTF